MALRTKIEPINRDIALMLSETLSPKAQSAALAEFAGAQIEDAKETDRRILGRVPRYTVSVDGRDGAPLQSVKPDGVVIAEFELFNDVLAWIADQLDKVSPFKSGRYRKNNTLFADGIETDVGSVLPDASEFAFINTTPYARKIERGASSQAPDGVFQVVATLARQRFGNIAKISFTYRTAVAGAFVGGRAGHKSDLRNPAILVKVRG
jgi:hypothetical protein